LDIEAFHDFVDGSDTAAEGFSETASQRALSELPPVDENDD
jgi:hypothetical protein